MRGFFGKTLATLGAMALLLTIGLTPVGASDQVPFTAHFAGGFVFNSDGTATTTASGTSTQLGNSTILGQMHPAPFGSHNCGALGVGFTATSTGILTAANGDQLDLSTTEFYCPTTAGGSVFHGIGSYIVTGGTGRFSGATGSGTVSCFGDMSHLPTGPYSVDATGTVSSPGAG